ncbi:hypothetical protein ACWDOR_43260 [Streptosporangium canum]
MAETEEGQQLAESIQEAAQSAGAMVSSLRAEIAGQDPETRQRIESLLGEIEEATADVLALQDDIPRMEAETRYLEQARAEQEARGERVPMAGAIGYEEWEASQFKACACPKVCPIHG